MNWGLLLHPPAPALPLVQEREIFQQEVVGAEPDVTTCTTLEAQGSFIALKQVVPPSAVQADANCVTELPLFGLDGVLASG